MLKRSAFLRKPPDADRLTVAVKKPAKPRMKKCRIAECRQPFAPRNMAHVCCSPVCAMAHIELERHKKERRERQAGLAKLKRRADHLADAQVAFNAFCRERDRAQQCISCDESLWRLAGVTGGNYDCGHFRSRGSAPHLRFHEDNAHGQCKRCNRYLSGNVTEYRPRLIARISLAAVEALEADQTPRKWTVDELIAIKTEYRAKLRALTNSRATG